MTDMPKTEPVTLEQFIAEYKKDDNEWWKLSDGVRQHFFDECVERLDDNGLIRQELGKK